MHNVSFKTKHEIEWLQAPTIPSSDFFDWFSNALEKWEKNGHVVDEFANPHSVDQDPVQEEQFGEVVDPYVCHRAELDPPLIPDKYQSTETLNSSRFRETSYTNRLRTVNWEYWLHQDL